MRLFDEVFELLKLWILGNAIVNQPPERGWSDFARILIFAFAVIWWIKFLILGDFNRLLLLVACYFIPQRVILHAEIWHWVFMHILQPLFYLLFKEALINRWVMQWDFLLKFLFRISLWIYWAVIWATLTAFILDFLQAHQLMQHSLRPHHIHRLRF